MKIIITFAIQKINSYYWKNIAIKILKITVKKY